MVGGAVIVNSMASLKVLRFFEGISKCFPRYLSATPLQRIVNEGDRVMGMARELVDSHAVAFLHPLIEIKNNGPDRILFIKLIRHHRFSSSKLHSFHGLSTQGK